MTDDCDDAYCIAALSESHALNMTQLCCCYSAHGRGIKKTYSLDQTGKRIIPMPDPAELFPENANNDDDSGDNDNAGGSDSPGEDMTAFKYLMTHGRE